MTPTRLSRRTALTGAGVSVALPLLEAMCGGGRRAYAAAPRRLVFFFSPNGTILDAWTPAGSETAFTLSRILAPLERHKKDLVVLSGVDNVVGAGGPGDGHQRGMGSMLTGTELVTTSVVRGQPQAGLGGGISVDQELVKQLRPPTMFPSLELGVQSKVGDVWSYSNYRGREQPLPVDSSPRSVVQRLFGAVTEPGAGAAAASPAASMRGLTDRRSVVDAVLRSYKSLSARVGTADRQKLEAHLGTVEELGKRILTPVGSPMPAGAGCGKPAATTMEKGTNDEYPLVGKTQMDLLVMALACDLTRVATLQWSESVGLTRFTWLGVTRDHHGLSHDRDSVLESKEALTKINVWYAEQLAYLIDRMKQVPEGTGTMFDNTLIVWINELSAGNTHSQPDMPFVLAGSAGGQLRTGRFLRYPGTVPHNNLLVSILNLFDVPATTFGAPAACTGRLTGLV